MARKLIDHLFLPEQTGEEAVRVSFKSWTSLVERLKRAEAKLEKCHRHIFAQHPLPRPASQDPLSQDPLNQDSLNQGLKTPTTPSSIRHHSRYHSTPSSFALKKQLAQCQKERLLLQKALAQQEQKIQQILGRIQQAEDKELDFLSPGPGISL